jgi:hypothetical protein
MLFAASDVLAEAPAELFDILTSNDELSTALAEIADSVGAQQIGETLSVEGVTDSLSRAVQEGGHVSEAAERYQESAEETEVTQLDVGEDGVPVLETDKESEPEPEVIERHDADNFPKEDDSAELQVAELVNDAIPVAVPGNPIASSLGITLSISEDEYLPVGEAVSTPELETQLTNVEIAALGSESLVLGSVSDLPRPVEAEALSGCFVEPEPASMKVSTVEAQAEASSSSTVESSNKAASPETCPAAEPPNPVETPTIEPSMLNLTAELPVEEVDSIFRVETVEGTPVVANTVPTFGAEVPYVAPTAIMESQNDSLVRVDRPAQVVDDKLMPAYSD